MWYQPQIISFVLLPQLTHVMKQPSGQAVKKEYLAVTQYLICLEDIHSCMVEAGKYDRTSKLCLISFCIHFDSHSFCCTFVINLNTHRILLTYAWLHLLSLSSHCEPVHFDKN